MWEGELGLLWPARTEFARISSWNAIDASRMGGVTALFSPGPVREENHASPECSGWGGGGGGGGGGAAGSDCSAPGPLGVTVLFGCGLPTVVAD